MVNGLFGLGFLLVAAWVGSVNKTLQAQRAVIAELSGQVQMNTVCIRNLRQFLFNDPEFTTGGPPTGEAKR